MPTRTSLLSCGTVLAFALCANTAMAQEPASQSLCRDRPCAVVVDWTRAGGITSQAPDRRYGNAAILEPVLKARLTEAGFPRHTSADAQDVRIFLQPRVENAMCDQMTGTATDMSCRAIGEVEVRVDGSEELTRDIDLPTRIRNRCSSERKMTVDRFAVFVADWIIYAVDGKAKGERRPVARC